MTEITRLLTANQTYAPTHVRVGDARPGRHLAVLTCMDCRIDVSAALGIDLGEAHVIRNAGGRVTEDVRRSLALSSHVLGVDTVVVMQHTGCGLAGATDAQLRQATGAAIEFLPIDDHARTLRDDVEALAATSYLDPIQAVAGFLYDLDTGVVDDVVRWERSD